MEITQNFRSKLDFFSELQVHIANLHMHFSNPSLDQHIKKKKKKEKIWPASQNDLFPVVSPSHKYATHLCPLKQASNQLVSCKISPSQFPYQTQINIHMYSLLSISAMTLCCQPLFYLHLTTAKAFQLVVHIYRATLTHFNTFSNSIQLYYTQI